MGFNIATEFGASDSGDTSGTVTQVNTTLPITGGPITNTGTIGISITPTNNGGAVALQAATPGTQQAGNFNIGGTGIASVINGVTGSSFNISTVATPQLAVPDFNILTDSATAPVAPGALAGGNLIINLGNAARNTSGNANGGSMFFEPGTGIGAGVTGYFAPLTAGVGTLGSSALPWGNIYGGPIQSGTVSSVTGSIALANSASAFLTTIQAGNAAAARTYTWPTNFGAAGTVLTDAAGNGTLSWAPGGGISGLTTGTIPKAASATTLNDSLLTQSGTGMTAATATKFNTTVANDNSTNFLSVIGTMPTSPSAQVNGVFENITGAGSASQANVAHKTTYNAGYTGNSQTAAGYFLNLNLGTATTPVTGNLGIYGVYGQTSGGASGVQVGVKGQASATLGGTGNAIGVLGVSAANNASVTNIGVVGVGATAGNNIGGYFTLAIEEVPSSVSGGIIVNNGAAAVPVAIFNSNGTGKVIILSGGQPRFSSDANLLFSSGTDAYNNGADTSISRKAAGVLSIGTQTLGNTSGALVTGGYSYGITAKKIAAYSTLATDYTILVDPTSASGAVAITLDNTKAQTGQVYVIHTTSTAAVNNVVITPSSGTIEGNANYTVNGVTHQTVMVQFDGTNWWVLVDATV